MFQYSILFSDINRINIFKKMFSPLFSHFIRELSQIHLIHFIPLPWLSWSWSYGSWIYNSLCNQCRSPLKLWVQTRSWRCVLDTILCDKVCQWLATDRWFSPGTLVSPTNKTAVHDIAEIMLKVALNTMTLTLFCFIH